MKRRKAVNMRTTLMTVNLRYLCGGFSGLDILISLSVHRLRQHDFNLRSIQHATCRHYAIHSSMIFTVTHYPTTNTGTISYMKFTIDQIPLRRLSPKLLRGESCGYKSWKSRTQTVTNHGTMKFRWKSPTQITKVADTNHLDMSRCLRQSPTKFRLIHAKTKLNIITS